MRLRTIDFIILLSLGILVIARSFWGLYQDINVDLSKSNSIIGRVVQANVTKIQASTIKLTKYKTVFAIQLDNSNEAFAVDRGISICNLLSSQIEIGDTIKIYYRSSTGEFNTHIFQIEKNNSAIIKLKDYSKKESGIIIWGLIFGFIITLGTIFWAIRQNKRQPSKPNPLPI
jgi:hypothetical protein